GSPPQLTDMLIRVEVDHMPGTLILEGIAAQRTAGSNQGRASRGGSQVGHMPSARIPPQLMDVLICAEIVHMPGILVLKGIAAQRAAGSSQGRASCSRSQIVCVPSTGSPPQLMDVLICTEIDHMLGILVFKGVAAQHTARSSEVVRVPSTG